MKRDIASLGGTIVEKASDEVNFLVAGSLMRNEKILVGLASGIPIVPKSYITSCMEQSQWLDVNDYEYGFDQFKSTNDKEAQSVFNSIKRWKSHYKTSKKVKLFCNSDYELFVLFRNHLTTGLSC